LAAKQPLAEGICLVYVQTATAAAAVGEKMLYDFTKLFQLVTSFFIIAMRLRLDFI